MNREREIKKDFEELRNLMIIHELKSPLAVMQSLAAKLRDEQPNHSDIKMLDYYANQSIGLVKMLIDWQAARDKMQNPEKETFPVATLVESLLVYHRQDLDIKKIKLEVNISSEMVLHNFRDYVYLLLSNLLKNAIHHSDCSKIVLYAENRENGSVTISVKDNGTGIPADLTDYIRSIIGSDLASPNLPRGLGFIIVETLLPVCGASLDFETSTEGSSFYIHFEPSIVEKNK